MHLSTFPNGSLFILLTGAQANDSVRRAPYVSLTHQSVAQPALIQIIQPIQLESSWEYNAAALSGILVAVSLFCRLLAR